MISVALKGVLGRKLRAVLTAFAIVLGVAMISGSLILTDTIARSFDGIYGESYKAADAVVSSKEATSNGETGGKTPSFAADVLPTVEALPGVAKAEGSTEDEARLVDGSGNEIGRGGVAFGVDRTDHSLSPLQLVSGQWPAGDAQIAIDGSTAKDEDIAVGDRLGAYGDGPVHQYEVAGIVRFGTADSLGATIAVFDLSTAQKLFDKQGELDAIRLGARPGVSPAALVHQVAPLLPETARVKTATAQAAADSKSTQSGVAFFRTFLLAFAGVALFVGAKVIANTFSITVSQRIRELATLRTLGASRRQVLRSVILEAGVIGLFASVVGLLTGVALAKGLYVVLGAVGIDLPETALVFAPRTVLASLVVGTGIAVLASLRPARRATRIQPIAAVREGATMPESRFARFANVGMGVVLIVATALLGYSVLATSAETKPRLIAFGVGALLLFRGLSMAAPRLIKPLASVLGAPGARIGGSAGELARQNAMRNPSRTAATAGALMIGLSVITFVAVLGQGAKSAFSASVDELFVADYAVVGSDDTPLTSKAAGAAASIPGVQLVSEIRSGEAKLGTTTVVVNGVDRNLSKVVHTEWSSGSGDVAANLGRSGAFVKKVYAEDHDLKVGSPLTLKTPTGAVLKLHVDGIFDEPKGGSPFGEISISLATFDRSFVTRGNDYTLLNVAGDPSEAATERIEAGLTAFPNATVETRDEFKSDQIKGLTQILNIVYALLGLSVIVSLFGIVNTLVLSVFERTRELGMLRAIGMTRRQVRRMIRHESIVTALIGATFGIAIGMTLAFLVTRMLGDNGVTFAVPFNSLAVFVGLAIVAGILAAILPARRASKLNVLNALQYE
jgi:putative ABC transport system permease protein